MLIVETGLTKGCKDRVVSSGYDPRPPVHFPFSHSLSQLRVLTNTTYLSPAELTATKYAGLCPIRGQYSGHVTSVDQSLVSLLPLVPQGDRGVWLPQKAPPMLARPTLGVGAEHDLADGDVLPQESRPSLDLEDDSDLVKAEMIQREPGSPATERHGLVLV